MSDALHLMQRRLAACSPSIAANPTFSEGTGLECADATATSVLCFCNCPIDFRFCFGISSQRASRASRRSCFRVSRGNRWLPSSVQGSGQERGTPPGREWCADGGGLPNCAIIFALTSAVKTQPQVPPQHQAHMPPFSRRRPYTTLAASCVFVFGWGGGEGMPYSNHHHLPSPER